MKRIISVISATLACLVISANERPLSFSHLSQEDGLSSMSTNDIYADPTGVIWIATAVGLDCYDGNTIRTIPPPSTIQNGTPDLFTKQIAGSGEGHIYVMYSNLIAVLDTRTDEFKPFYRGMCNCITYSDGLWIGKGNSILYAEKPDGSVNPVRTIPADNGDVTAILRTRSGDIWIGTSDGILLYYKGDIATAQPQTYSGKLHSQIFRIYEDSNGTIWSGSLLDGALAISSTGRQNHYRHDSADSSTISSNFVRAFCEDNLGNIWIGTYTGLDCLSPSTGNIRRHNTKTPRPGAITHSSIWSIRKDRQGTIWAATYYGGVNYFNPEHNIYEMYQVSSTEGKGLSSPIVSKIIEDLSGNLWIGTEGGGLNRLDKNTGRTTWYNTDSPAGRQLTENNIKDMIYVPSDNAIWVGLHIGGINRVDIRTGKVRAYRNDPLIRNSLPSDDVLSIADYGDSLIVRTRVCVCVMDKKTGGCRPIVPLRDYQERGTHIRLFLLDEDDNIWVCARNPRCLIRLAPPYTSAKVYTKENVKGDFCSSEISCLMQDESGKMWLASSEEGFYVYDRQEDSFTSLGGEFTLRGTHQMAQSPSSGNIICSSEDGFIVFNPITHHARLYGKEMGFPLRNSHTQAINILDDSRIFIGGYGGLVSVSEKDLDFPRKPYRLFITSLTVNGEKVETGSDILPESILTTSSITLPASTRSIELMFSSSNHISSRFTTFDYQLEGFDHKWNQASGERRISYTNLPSGRYSLLLKPSSEAHADICPVKRLDIRIMTPWYATWLAIAVYIMFIIAAIILIISFYTSRVQMKSLESLNQAKLRFFTNISHEIRTPLTIIIAGIESIIQQHNFSPAMYRKILEIYKNSISLRELISELMEFRKQELGQMAIKAAPHNLIFFINEYFLLFNEYAASKGISLSLKHDIDRLEVWYDQTQMQKALNNILSNSIKFTPAGGSVTIRVYSTKAAAVIEISDTGCGIPEKDIKKIFNRFYQVESSPDINTGTGIGLALAQGIVKLHSGTIEVESVEGNGSMFRITLPLGYSHFSKEQISSQLSKGRGLDIADKISIPTGKAATDAEETSHAKKGHTIVIAEDNLGVLNMLVELFSPFYKVIQATDGTSALEAVRTHLPSLVLSDVLMPGLNGTQLCKIIKNDPALCHIPVVLLTARVEVEQNLEGLQQGADDYITKPFNSTLLLSRCNNLVNSRIMLQEKYGNESGSSAWMRATNRMDNDFLDRITDVIYNNLDDTAFGINELLKAVGLSRTRFFRKLKAVTGQTPSEFILTIRLKKGADLLRHNPEMNINEISDAIGFNTPKYFAKCFKDHYGKSPLTWRKENTETKP